MWESSKRAEHGRASAFDGIPHALPALTRAQKVGRKAEALGLGGGAEALGLGAGAEDLRGAVAAVQRDPTDVEAFGVLLAAVVAAAREGGVDPEDALRRRVDADEAVYRSRESEG